MYSLSPFSNFPPNNIRRYSSPSRGGRREGVGAYIHMYGYPCLGKSYLSCLALCWVLWYLPLVSLLHDWNVVLQNKAGICGDEIPEVALHHRLVGEQQERRHIVHRPDQLLRMKVTILQ
jgi:hypothetical protein